MVTMTFAGLHSSWDINWLACGDMHMKVMETNNMKKKQKTIGTELF